MANSRFVSHIRLWAIVAPLLLIAIAPMLPDDQNFEISPAEQASVETVLGTPRAMAATHSTNARFQKWFIESGAVKATVGNMQAEELISDGGAASLAGRWVEHFWLMIYRAIYRASILGAWLPGTLLIFFAAMNDGAVYRRIKAAAAGMVSPVSFHLAVHGVLLIAGIGASALMLPIALRADLWVLAAIALITLGWRMAASSSSFA